MLSATENKNSGEGKKRSACESRRSLISNPHYHRVFTAAATELAGDGGFGLLEDDFRLVWEWS